MTPPGSESAISGVLASWRSGGRAPVADHWAEFQQLVGRIEPLVRRRRFAEAAGAAQIATNYAVNWHPGLFASAALERALWTLGEASLPMLGPEPRAIRGRLRVLHVATKVSAIGGHTRMISRWIQQDVGNVHSIALTRQTDRIPAGLRAAVSETGGQIHQVNRSVAGLLGWARRLQAVIAGAVLVVLHVHNDDVVPFLALAGMKRKPPVILLNHADHVFWLGVDFVDLVVNTRRSGHMLCAGRRGVTSERNALLPLCLEPVTRQADRKAAKLALGIPEDSIVVLTIARAPKYQPMGGLSLVDLLLPLLRADGRMRLLAVGPGGAVDWFAAEAEVPGQILTFRERPDTRGFLEAADLYVQLLSDPIQHFAP